MHSLKDKTSKPTVQKVVVAGVIIDDRKILLLHRDNKDKVFPGLWELPSGKKEHNETTRQALKREVVEETGLSVEPGPVVDVFDYLIEKPDEFRNTVQINFIANIVGEVSVSLSDEHQGYAWVAKDNLSKYKVSPETETVILKAFAII